MVKSSIKSVVELWIKSMLELGAEPGIKSGFKSGFEFGLRFWMVRNEIRRASNENECLESNHRCFVMELIKNKVMFSVGYQVKLDVLNYVYGIIQDSVADQAIEQVWRRARVDIVNQIMDSTR